MEKRAIALADKTVDLQRNGSATSRIRNLLDTFSAKLNRAAPGARLTREWNARTA